MYIVASILFFSFIEIVTMLLFRAWEIKRGRIDPHTRMSFDKDVIDHTHHHVKHYLGMVGGGGKRVIGWTLGKFHRTKTRFGAETGITKMRDMVKGRGEFDSERGSASGYLQDITDHRDSVRGESSK